jgi:hypothetical protein
MSSDLQTGKVRTKRRKGSILIHVVWQLQEATTNHLNYKKEARVLRRELANNVKNDDQTDEHETASQHRGRATVTQGSAKEQKSRTFDQQQSIAIT